MRYPNILVLALFLLIVLLPAGVYAATDHSGHGGSIDNASSLDMNMTGDNHDMDMAGDGSESHNQMTLPETEYKESGAKHSESAGSNSSAGGGHDSSGHNGGSEKSNLEPVKNNIVSGFAGINALIIIAAAIMKMKYRQGV